MAQGDFTKQEAHETIIAFLEVVGALTGAKKVKFFGHANDIMLFLEAAQRAAPKEPTVAAVAGR